LSAGTPGERRDITDAAIAYRYRSVDVSARDVLASLGEPGNRSGICRLLLKEKHEPVDTERYPEDQKEVEPVVDQEVVTFAAPLIERSILVTA
jgi:hypothetical protein